MRIATWNVNSIRARKERLLDWLSLQQFPDSVCLQETKVTGETMTSKAQLSIPKEQLAVFCRRHHIRKLSLFGSVLREDFRPDSDVDVLVEFVPGNVPGFIRLGSIEEELEQFFDGRKVDLLSF